MEWVTCPTCAGTDMRRAGERVLCVNLSCPDYAADVFGWPEDWDRETQTFSGFPESAEPALVATAPRGRLSELAELS